VVGRNEVPAVVNSNLRHCRDDPQHGPTMELNLYQLQVIVFDVRKEVRSRSKPVVLDSRG
jgi:hypothetical protein